MKPEARAFEMSSPKKQYKIMQCCIFFHFSSKCLVCVICCIQSTFIVFQNVKCAEANIIDKSSVASCDSRQGKDGQVETCNKDLLFNRESPKVKFRLS